MGFKSFLKGSKEKPKLLIGGGAELELPKHFRLLRKLGHGSFATVYEAERLTDGQRYALKVTELRALSQLDKAAVVEEIRLLASLSHPNIISYYEAFCDHDKLCVVTELVAGGDLGSFVAKLRQDEGLLWEREVWAYFLQVALGVQYLHHNHVLHRDLKPQNIMLTRKGGAGLLKIADLGVSAELALVFTNIQIGTPHYMAPEMWNRQAYSYSADIWALGCILHELCTLRPTFLSDSTRTEEDIKQRVLAGRYDPIPARFSLDLSRLVALMLRRDPKERPTIDEIMGMPEVRSKLGYLPQELRDVAAAADGSGHQERGRLRESHSLEWQLPEEGDDMRRMNCLMPRPRYATGGGVADLLCRSGGTPPLRRSFSSPDIERLAAAAAAAAGEGGGGSGSGGESGGQRAAGGARVGSPPRPRSAAGLLGQPPADDGSSEGSGGGSDGGDGFANGGGGVGVHYRPGSSLGSLGLEEGEEARLRRRSIMVGELMHRLQQEQEEAAAAAEGGSGGAAAEAGAEGGEEGAGGLERGPSADGRRRRLSLDHPLTDAERRRSPTPPPGWARASGGGSSGGGSSGAEVSVHGGMGGPGRPGSGSGGGAGGGDGEEGSARRRPAGMTRRSVAVAQVLHHQDVKKKLGERPAGRGDDLTRLAGPLPRQPFEFCASAATPPPATPRHVGAATNADAPTQSAQQQQGQGQGQGQGQHPPQPATPAASAGVGAAAASSATERRPEGDAGQKKKKKAGRGGRLWRLMYGDHDSSMHQDWF